MRVLRHEVICADKMMVIKKTPFRLLVLLVRHSERVVSRMEMFKEIWGFDFDTGTKRIEVQLHYLRQVLSHLSSSVTIKTHRGAGLRVYDTSSAAPSEF
ncbi:Heme response regulator HssR [compost metagenome]